MSTVSRELLWQAYPNGFLAMRGVSTLGGYLYWANEYWITDPGVLGTPGHSKAEMWGICDPATCEPLKLGHLLPDVDPRQVATWACAKSDLAVTAGVIDREDPGTPEVAFSCASQFGEAGGNWYLIDYQGARVGKACTFHGLNTEDPALALVLARISLRKEGK